MSRARGSRVLTVAVAAARAGATPAVAGATVSTGHSGWSWSNPSPQGEDIADLAFAGSTGYAVGGFGTLLRSTDSGSTWTGLPSATVQDLTRVETVGATGFVTSGVCAVRRSGDSGATLGTIDVGGGDTGCGSTVLAVAFSDASNGLILFASGVILGTGDGGVSLSRRTPIPGSPTDLVAVSPTTAFATSTNAVYRTVDAGASWTLVAVVPRVLRSLTFASATVGYAVGDGGTVLRTTDGGANWVPVPTAPGGDLRRVRCADENLCLFTTASGANIIRTPDGGATYTQVTASASPIRAIAFASATRAVAAGDGGVTVLSDDGGVTWRTSSSAITGQIGAIGAGAGGFAYATGPAAVSLTSDGGDTWKSVGIPTARSIARATFADPLTGYVQDDGGTLRRTTNGGASWQILDPSPAAGALQDIVTLGAGRVLLVTADGVARSVDGGDTLSLVRSPVLRRTAVIRRGIIDAVGSGRRAFIVGRAGLLVTTDAGATWTQARLPRVGRRTPTIAHADCIAPRTCWIATTGSRLYRTSTAGTRWVEVTPALGVALRTVAGIAAAGPSQAFVTLRATASTSGGQGVVLHTADGGLSWTPELVGRDPVGALDAVAGRAWALAGQGRIFTTATGGRTAVASVLTLKASRRTIRRPATITVTGRLAGATGGEQVTLHASAFAPRVLTVASNGSFSTTIRIKRTTTFVAQWAGDGVRSGDGTRALVVRRR